ncbi:MAG: hypothetical protein GWN11_03835 [Candidatus Dadabacteria bacterium]|nr:hypothetical protein [Candidatus Dadabacteria bacterium]NIX15014.1 hypothetical protein [Candidatus Dadabacteria bacterium]
MTIIDIILTKSNPKPIIIIQSDEGHYARGYSYSEPNLLKYSAEQLKYKFAIFNAYYFPDVDQNELYPTITPVNSFRLLFNTYFGQNYEMLERKHFNKNYYKYYKFLDVTAKITN